MLKTILIKAQKTYYYNKFKSLSGDLRYTWKLIGTILKSRTKQSFDTLIKDGIEISDNMEIVNKFNEYFVNIGSNLAASIPPPTSHFSSYLKKYILQFIFLFYD